MWGVHAIIQLHDEIARTCKKNDNKDKKVISQTTAQKVLGISKFNKFGSNLVNLLESKQFLSFKNKDYATTSVKKNETNK